MTTDTASTTSLADGVARWFADNEARQDPHPLFDRLREEDPVHYSDAASTWVVTRYADVNAVLRAQRAHRAPSSGRDAGAWLYDDDGELRPAHRLASLSFRYQEGDPHVRLRLLVGRALNSPNVAKWQDDIDREADEAVDRVREGKAMDLVADFGYMLPLLQILRVLGIGTDELALETYRDWSTDILHAQAYTATPEETARGDASALEFEAFLLDLIRRRRAQPGSSDLLTALIEAEDGRERLTDDELVSVTFGLISAGHETTAGLIGTATNALLRHPDQLTLLVDRPELLPDAVEEALRYDGPAQWVPRFPAEDLELAGRAIPAGDHIALMILAADHDPTVFADPHRFAVERPEKNHLAFAAGAHSCLGTRLARTEAKSALRALLTLPGLEADGSAGPYAQMSSGRAITSLPVRWR